MSALTVEATAPVTEPVLRLLPLPASEQHEAVRVWVSPEREPRPRRGREAQATQQTLRLVVEPAAPPLPDGAHDTDDPAMRHWVAQFVQVAVEIGLGLRPAAQLLRWTSDDVHAQLARRCLLAQRAAAAGDVRRAAARARVRAVRLCTPAEGITEAAVVVQAGPRARAIALRVESRRGRHRVVALEQG